MSTRAFTPRFAVLAGGVAMLAACGGDKPSPALDGGLSAAQTDRIDIQFGCETIVLI